MSVFLRSALIAVLVTGFLALTAGRQIMARNGGEELVLEAAPVDPRDILLGHYVALSYAIERLDLSALEGDDAFESGDSLFLELTPQDGAARPAAIYKSRPAQPGGVILEGRAITAARASTEDPEGVPGSGRFLIARFDLPRRYYADAETALALETELRENGFQVILSQQAGHPPVLKGLIVDGERRVDTVF